MRRLDGSSRLAPLAAFFVGAVVVSALGGPLLLGLLVGAVAGFAYRPLRRDPPWTARGRAAWHARARRGAEAWQLWRRLRWQWRRATAAPPAGGGVREVRVDPLPGREAARFDAAFAVRCEFVGERFQVWHARDTGRAYEVALRDGPADAAAGDEGWLAFEGGRPRVRAVTGDDGPVEVERVLN